MLKKSLLTGLFAALVMLTFTGCANHFEGEVGEITTYGNEKEKVYLFDTLDQLANSLLYIENKEFGQLTAGLKKDFNKEKEGKITYDKEPPSKIVYSELGKKVVAKPTSVWHEVSKGTYMSRGYYTGAIVVYVYSDAEERYSDGWVFDFHCDTK